MTTKNEETARQILTRYAQANRAPFIPFENEVLIPKIAAALNAKDAEIAAARNTALEEAMGVLVGAPYDGMPLETWGVLRWIETEIDALKAKP